MSPVNGIILTPLGKISVLIVCNGQGIAEGGELVFRPPEPLPGFFIKLNIKN